MAWGVDPRGFNATRVVNFSQGAHADSAAAQQFPWMEAKMFGKASVTKAGCCMAFTVYFFDWYRTHNTMTGYFKWVQSVKGVTSIMNLQTKYLGFETHGQGAALTNNSNGVATFLNALRRKTEDQIYGALNFQAVASPYFPSRVGSLPGEVMEDYTNLGCVYKPIYLAALGGEAHAIGAVLDYAQSCYTFFDPNEGAAVFNDEQDMRNWLDQVVEEYKGQYTAYFIDTKQ